MVLFIALILVIIWASIMAWVYSVINPFVNELWNIQRYNQAYYGAIASVERAELVLRWHIAGFEWSWGWLWDDNYWNDSDHNSDLIKKEYFEKLAMKNIGNWIFWSIKNMTNWTVPEPWKWDLDPDISSGNNFYKLTFDHSLQFAFYNDVTWTGKYYTGVEDTNINQIKIDDNVNVSIRAPFKLVKKYNDGTSDNRDSSRLILDKNGDNDLDGDGINDDIIVNRTIFWNTWDTQFTIFPSINVDDNKPADNDTSIREDVINGYVNNTTDSHINVKFDTSTSSKDTNPVNASKRATLDVSEHNTNVDKFNQSPDDAVKTGFNIVFNSNNITDVNLKFSLVNLLKYDNTHVYPYLEVKLLAKDSFGNPLPIPDQYFHILGEGKVVDYDVKILISKPVFDTTAASDFTVLF